MGHKFYACLGRINWALLITPPLPLIFFSNNSKDPHVLNPITQNSNEFIFITSIPPHDFQLVPFVKQIIPYPLPFVFYKPAYISPNYELQKYAKTPGHSKTEIEAAEV